MIEIRISAPNANALASRIGAAATALPGALQAAITEATGVVDRRVRELTPARTGRLRGSIYSEVRELVGIVASRPSDAPYGPVVEDGSRPHTITPRTAGGLLAFRGRDGRTVLARRVAHPGFRGRRMFATAASQTIQTIRGIVSRHIARILSRSAA